MEFAKLEKSSFDPGVWHYRPNRDGKAQSDTPFRVSPGARCASNPEEMIHHIENSRKSTQLCLNFISSTSTRVTEALCRSRASSWEQTPLLEPSTRRWCPTPRRWTCPMLFRQQPNGCMTWGMNAFVYKETKKEFFSCYWTKWQKECRPERQDWQILRQVPPTQSHPSNGAAEKAVSTVRGLA